MADAVLAPPTPRSPSLVRMNYLVRTAAFAGSFAILAVHGWERALPPAFWIFLVLQFIVYPRAVYRYAVRSRDPAAAEVRNMYLDALLFGAWAAALGFSVWITYAFLFATSLNAAINRALAGLFVALLCFGAGAGLWVVLMGHAYGGATSPLVTVLVIAALLVYAWAVGYIIWLRNRGLRETKAALRKSEETYRTIAECAGDLVAIVDRAGCWVYTSPSCERYFDPADLAAGANAFRRLSAADADAAHVAVLTAAPGKVGAFAVGVKDRAGRQRRLRFRVEAVARGPNEAPWVVLAANEDRTADVR